MKLNSVRSFYRYSGSGSAEDGIAINLQNKIFAVSDGVSGPYSPSNPGVDYGILDHPMTGGQAISRCIQSEIAEHRTRSLDFLLKDANFNAKVLHKGKFKDPLEEAVAGACVASCQVLNNEIKFIVAGDSAVLFQDEKGFHFIGNFDEAAFAFEEKGNEAFEDCKQKAKGDIGKAWDLYYNYFAQKQFFRANKNLGKGGHAMLNGDPNFLSCCTVEDVSYERHPLWVLLMTDGMLHRDFRPERVQINDLAVSYIQGGFEGILEWQKGRGELPHIKQPEASAIELKFS